MTGRIKIPSRKTTNPPSAVKTRAFGSVGSWASRALKVEAGSSASRTLYCFGGFGGCCGCWFCCWGCGPCWPG